MKTMALRICDITMFYPSSTASGVKNYILAKKAYLLRHTDHIHASIVPAERSATQCHNERDYHFAIQSPRLPWNRDYRLLLAATKVKAAIDEFQPDIIEFGCPYNLPWMVRRIYAKKNGPRPQMFGFYHADFPQQDIYRLLQPISPAMARLLRWLAKRYAKSLYNRLDLCLCSSTRIEQRLRATGVTNTAALPFGVDVDTFQPQEQLRIDDDILRLLYVGRLSAEKGILPFVQLMHSVATTRKDITLTVVGSGNLQEKLHKQADGAPYLKLRPAIQNDQELARLYAMHDLYIVPNPWETFCRSALEAMACGTPVASLNGHGGIETFVNLQTGFLLGEELSAFVPFLKQLSKTKLNQMRPQVRDFVVKHFHQNTRFSQLCKVYEKHAISHHQYATHA